MGHKNTFDFNGKNQVQVQWKNGNRLQSIRTLQHLGLDLRTLILFVESSFPPAKKVHDCWCLLPDFADFESDHFCTWLITILKCLVRMNVTGSEGSLQGEFPHHASLRRASMPNKALCSAAIIHPLLLLTTANCVNGFNATEIIAVTGDYRKSTLEGTEQVRTVTQMITHGNFTPLTWDNDIALLVLAEPLQFDNYTRAIEIPRSKSRKGKFSFC